MVLRNPSNLEKDIFKLLWEETEDGLHTKTWVDAAFLIEDLFKKHYVSLPEITE